jgi:uncharacterized membrane protein
MPSSIEPEGKKTVGLERLIFFSDAVFAIAITLLVLEIRLPTNVEAANLADHWGALIPEIASYGLSFFVIGAYWIAHHRLYEFIIRYDSRILWLNLLLLLFVAFIPFPTSLVSEAAHTLGVNVLYSTTITLTGLALYANWWYATSGHRLVAPDLDAAQIRRFGVRTLSTPLVFLLAIIAGLLDAPSVAIILWGAAALVALVPPVFLSA